MKREELKKELKDVKILYVVGRKKGTNPNWDRGIWREFNIYYIKDGELKRIYFDENEECPVYWKKKKGCFICRALGTDRVFEIVYDLGFWLFGDGYHFKDVFLNC